MTKNKQNNWEEKLDKLFTYVDGYRCLDDDPHAVIGLKDSIKSLLSQQRQEIIDEIEKWIKERRDFVSGGSPESYFRHTELKKVWDFLQSLKDK